MEWLYKGLSALFLFLFLFSTVKTARTFRREKLLRPQALLLTAFLTAIIYLVYVLILGVAIDGKMALAMGLGLAVGWVWGISTKVEATAQGAAGKGTLAGFVIWAALMAGLQLANLVQVFSPGMLILVGAFQSAVLFGYNLILARRCPKAVAGGVTVEA